MPRVAGAGGVAFAVPGRSSSWLRRASDDARLWCYIAGVEAWLRSHQDWYGVTTRYQTNADVDIWTRPDRAAGRVRAHAGIGSR